MCLSVVYLKFSSHSSIVFFSFLDWKCLLNLFILSLYVECIELSFSCCTRLGNYSNSWRGEWMKNNQPTNKNHSSLISSVINHLCVCVYTRDANDSDCETVPTTIPGEPTCQPHWRKLFCFHNKISAYSQCLRIWNEQQKKNVRRRLNATKRRRRKKTLYNNFRIWNCDKCNFSRCEFEWMQKRIYI